VDYLGGLKENVIMGRLIPAGTGMEYYRQVKIQGEDVEEETLVEETAMKPVSRATTRTPGSSTPAASQRARPRNWPSSFVFSSLVRRAGAQVPAFFVVCRNA
jgi:hypothetical protein